MPKYIKQLAWMVLPLGLIGAYLCGQQSGFNGAQIDWDNPPKWVVLPDKWQIQKIIGCEQIDGKWGKETNEKFELYMNNQFGINCYTLSEN